MPWTENQVWERMKAGGVKFQHFNKDVPVLSADPYDPEVDLWQSGYIMLSGDSKAFMRSLSVHEFFAAHGLPGPVRYDLVEQPLEP